MIVSAQIDEKELNSLIKDLEGLSLSDSKTKTLLRRGMRKSAKPIQQELKDLVPKESGQLRKSLAIINGKMRRGNPPSVYVGPRVKGAYSDKNKSGFYFYFLEYGFRGKPGLRMLDKAASSKGGQAINSVIDEIKTIIDKKFK